MPRRLLVCLWVLLAPTCFAMPPLTEPDAIVIMKSEGSYLNIFPDGSARAGFGALPPCAGIPSGTFDFARLLQTELSEERVAARERRTSAPAYIAVGFSRNGTARMYHFADWPLVERLFERAEGLARLPAPGTICPFPS